MAAVTSARRAFVLAFVACWALGTAWALATPPYSGPDEPAHVFRAYAAGGGEVIGEDTDFTPGIIGRPTLVEVPRSLSEPGTTSGCFIRRPEVPAGCETGDDADGTSIQETGAGRNPPLYHLIVSPPLRWWPDDTGVYLARVVGAGVAAALLAGAVALCWSRRRPGILAGAFVACTPMVWFLNGVVNASSLEIAGAVATWVGGIALLDDWRRGERAGEGALAVLVCGGVALAQGRGLGPLWVGVVGAALLVAAWCDGTARRLLEDRRAQVGAAIVGVAALANLAFVVQAGSLEGPGERQDLGFLDAVSESFRHQSGLWRTAFDTFGWFDAIPPLAVAVTWVALALALVLLALAVATPRWALVLLGVLGAGIVVPVVVEASQRPELGAVWQGRYSLPVLAGVPLVAGWLVDRARPVGLPDGRFLVGLIVLGTGAHALAFWFALRRWAVGAGGGDWFLGADTWLGGALVPVALGGLLAVAGVGLGAAWGSWSLGRADEPDAAGSAGPEPARA